MKNERNLEHSLNSLLKHSEKHLVNLSNIEKTIINPLNEVLKNLGDVPNFLNVVESDIQKIAQMINKKESQYFLIRQCIN